MRFFLHSAMITLYGAAAYGVLHVWLLAIVGSPFADVLGLALATCVVLATLLVGSLLEWSPGLRTHVFLAGTALAWITVATAWSLLFGWGAVVSAGLDLRGFLVTGFMGALVVAPVALPLGWGLVLVSRIEAEWWDARAQA